jgi:hypothetical protein
MARVCVLSFLITSLMLNAGVESGDELVNFAQPSMVYDSNTQEQPQASLPIEDTVMWINPFYISKAAAEKTSKPFEHGPVVTKDMRTLDQVTFWQEPDETDYYYASKTGFEFRIDRRWHNTFAKIVKSAQEQLKMLKFDTRPLDTKSDRYLLPYNRFTIPLNGVLAVSAFDIPRDYAKLDVSQISKKESRRCCGQKNNVTYKIGDVKLNASGWPNSWRNALDHFIGLANGQQVKIAMNFLRYSKYFNLPREEVFFLIKPRKEVFSPPPTQDEY